MINPRNKGKSSERIAEGILKKRGFTILERNKIVEKKGEEAFEVDIIARTPKGEKCCIEVKAGEASVSDVRHAFANSKMLNCRPLIISKGFSNKSAETVAEELEVQIINLSDAYLTEPEELEILVRSALQDVLVDFGFYPLPPRERISNDEMNLISTIAYSESFASITAELKVSKGELGKKIGELRKKGILPQRSQSFTELQKFARHIIRRYSITQRIERIEKRMEHLEEEIKKLREALD